MTPAQAQSIAANSHADLLVQQRFEAKYLLTAVQHQLVRDYVKSYTQSDSHDAVYPVTSVYYDNSSWSTFRASLDGEKNRFKLRVRTYGHSPQAACYAEVKQRVDRIVMKRRVRLNRTLPEMVAADVGHSIDTLMHPDREREVEAFEYFQSLVIRLGATPRAGVRYMREAYQSVVDEPVRITLDTNISYAPVNELRAEQASWRVVTRVPAVLEVKFTDTYPYWIRRMVDRFELNRVSLAKYVVCVQEMSRDGALTRREQESLPTWTL